MDVNLTRITDHQTPTKYDGKTSEKKTTAENIERRGSERWREREEWRGEAKEEGMEGEVEGGKDRKTEEDNLVSK